MIDLKQDVQYVKGVGPNNVVLLQKLGINTLEDLCNTSKKDLIEMKIPKQEIEEIEKGLKLLGGNIRD